jgi:hypothetical protein
MDEARGGDGRPADTGRTERVQRPQPPQRAETAETATNVPATPEKTAAASREGKLDLSVPQVAGSAVAAIVAAKLASNLGVYGTIVGAGVVSVLGTCGGSILQHVFRRTGRQVQEVAVQARPGVRRGREQARPRTDAAGEAGRTRVLPETYPTGTRPLTGTNPPTGTGPLTGTGPVTGASSLTGTDAGGVPGTDPALAQTGAAPDTAPAPAIDTYTGADAGQGDGDGYGAATSHRAGRRGWKRPVVAVTLAFGLTMGGITGYEAIAGENISGHGHGTTIGNAVTGGNSAHSGGTTHTPAPSGTDTPSGGATTTSPRGSDGGGQPGQDTTPSTPHSAGTPSTGTGSGTGGGTSGSGHSTPAQTSPPPTSASPSPSPTASDESGENSQKSQTGENGENSDGADSGVAP